MIHDGQCCSWDEDGNPEVCSGSAKEKPDCLPCGDTGYRYVDVDGDPADWWDESRRGPLTRVNCPDCDPTDEQHAAWLAEAQRRQAEYEAAVARGEINEYEEMPF